MFGLAFVVFWTIAFLSVSARAQDDPNDTPLGDVARDLRKGTPSQTVIDNDNLTQVMNQAESKHLPGSALRFLMGAENHGFHVSTADVTCSLSFSANTKALLSSQYAQMDLPQDDVVKLVGPAAIEGDAFTVSVFNGTDWHVSEVDVALTVVKKNLPVGDQASVLSGIEQPATLASAVAESEARPEKKADTTMIYRMRAAAAPWAKTVFSAPLNLNLAPGDEWHWALVEAKGYPPQGYMAKAEQTTAASVSTTTPSQTPVIPASLLQQDSSAAMLPQVPRQEP
jgi:hypothetical protein